MMVVKSIVIFAFILQIVPLILLLERKLLGRFQSRIGPNRVGPKGLMQPLADVFKLLSKESSTPDTAVPWMMAIAPVISIFTAVATLAIIPFGPFNAWGGEFGLYGIDVSIGLLYFFAFGSLGFYGLVLGGWASGSKYSFLGAMRAAAQLISYEVALGLSLLGVAMTAGSLSLVDIVEAQDGMWYVVPQFVGFCIFMVAGFAETARAPFDLPEGDAEIVGGYNTEYGGMRFGSFFMAEYIEVIVISAIAAACFLGGWHGPGPVALAPLWMLLKLMAGRAVLHLDPRVASAPALRPADVVRLEGAAARSPPSTCSSPRSCWWPPDGLGSREGRGAGGPRPRARRASGAVYRVFGETLRGLRTTFGRVVEGPVTVEYPEEKTPVYPRFRGRHKLHRFEDTGLEKCVGCSLCAAACPAKCIRVVAAENTPDHQVSAGERYAEVYEINMARCIFCGYCEVACPFDAITMGNDYELADYSRSDLIFTKEMLLADPPEHTPLRREGE